MGNVKYTKESAVEKAKSKFGDKFDYSKVKYVRYKKPVEIGCPEHGYFTTTFQKHINSVFGCSSCYDENRSKVFNSKLTFEECLVKAKCKHGEKFDYSKAVFKSYTEPIEIVCPEHGPFMWNMKAHIHSNHGCKECSGANGQKSIDEWKTVITQDTLKRLEADRAFLFNQASLIEHFGVHHEMLTKILQDYSFDLSRFDNRKRKTSEDWVKEARKIHGDRFDYSKVHENFSTKGYLKVICKEHGEYLQHAEHHILRGSVGCKPCESILRRETYEKNTMRKSEFIRRSKEVHGDRYDYSKTKQIKNTKEEVEIVCRKHGSFWQNIYNHMKGHGCDKCAAVLRSKQMSSDTEEFVTKAKAIHGDLYDYSKVEYKKAIENVTINCVYHGDFEQTPNSHLNGAGCNVCGSMIYHLNLADRGGIEESKQILSGIYFIYFPSENFYKVGISKRIKHRLRSIAYKTRYEPEILIYKKVSLFDAFMYENRILTNYKDFKYKPKKYFPGNSECFNKHILVNEIISLIDRINEF